jgi:hypothetical protein
VAYGPVSQMGGIGIFYSSSLLWDSNLSSFHVKGFTNSNSRFLLLLPPSEPFIPDDRLLHQKTSKILSDVLLRTCAHHFCNSLPPSTPMDNYIHMPFILPFSIALVITRYIKIFSDFLRILVPLPCSSLPHEYPYG